MSFESAESIAVELRDYTENERSIYDNRTLSILKNLATKKVTGKYDRDKAVDMFMYLAEAGAKDYTREYGGAPWHVMFPVAARKIAAQQWRDEFEVEYGFGNYDHLLLKKYQKSPEALKRADAKIRKALR